MMTPIFREWFVLSSLILQRVYTGLMHGLPAILSPVITSDGSDIHITREEAAWFNMIGPMSGIIGYLFVPSLMQTFGRRFTNAYLNIINLIGTVIIASADNYTWLLVGRVIQGTAFCQTLISFVTSAEYSHPKRRGSVITMTLAAITSGVTLCHGLSATLTWRQICWVFTVPSILGLVSTFFWPESPSWLAYKGRYQDCENAFRWLRGDDPEAKQELEELIAAQREIKHRKQAGSSIKNTLKSFISKEFRKSILIVTFGILFSEASGMHYIAGYIIEIMNNLTGDKSKSLVFAVSLDLMRVLSVVIATRLVRKFNRRFLMSTCGTVSIIILAFVSCFSYLNENNLLSLSWIPATMMILYCCLLDFALPVINIIKGEIFPIGCKGLGITVAGMVQTFTLGLVMKLTSIMLASLHIYGTFFVYVVIMTGSLALYILILPETKDRTLQNIENEILGLKICNKDMEVEMASMVKN